MNDDKRRLTPQDVEGEGLSDWRILFRTLHARFETGSFATGLELVNRIGAAAEERNHHPDVDLTYPRVDVRLTSHDTGGVTSRDVELARHDQRLRRRARRARPTRPPSRCWRSGSTAPTASEIMPFWAAVLGCEPDRRSTTSWSTGPGGCRRCGSRRPTRTRPPRQRFHLDIRVPPEVAAGRIQAAIDAGGTLVTDEYAPTFWVLADAQGNKACVCHLAGPRRLTAAATCWDRRPVSWDA